jgi:hypothetical protein
LRETTTFFFSRKDRKVKAQSPGRLIRPTENPSFQHSSASLVAAGTGQANPLTLKASNAAAALFGYFFQLKGN